jgi:hypothetical protein
MFFILLYKLIIINIIIITYKNIENIPGINLYLLINIFITINIVAANTIKAEIKYNSILVLNIHKNIINKIIGTYSKMLSIIMLYCSIREMFDKYFSNPSLSLK